jgi:ABC-type glycerol-3-phosphate transport system substrate-binding protein
MKDRLLADSYILPEGWEKATEGVKEIVYINWGSMKGDIATYIAMKNFERKTGIKIKNLDITHAYVNEKQLALLTAKDPSVHSFYIGDAQYYLRQFLAGHWFAPVDFLWPPEVREIYPKGYVESIYMDGHYWGTPHFTSTYILYYRPSWLQKAGVTKVPETWKEVFEAAKKCREWAKTNLGKDYYGYVFPGGRETLYDLDAMTFSQGGKTVRDGKINLLTPEFTNAWNSLLNLIYEDVADKGSLTYTWTDAADAFGAGKAAFHLERTAYVASYQTQYPAIKDDWDVTLPPKWSLEQPDTYHSALMWNDVLAVNPFAEPKHQAATMLWHDFRRSKESLMYEVIVEGNESSLPAVYDEPDRLIKEVINWDLVREAAKELLLPEPIIPTTLPKADIRGRAMSNATVELYPAGIGGQFANLLGEFFGKAGTKQLGASEALNKLQEEINKFQ